MVKTLRIFYSIKLALREGKTGKVCEDFCEKPDIPRYIRDVFIFAVGANGLAKCTDFDLYGSISHQNNGKFCCLRIKTPQNSLLKKSDVLVEKCTENCDCVAESALLASP